MMTIIFNKKLLTVSLVFVILGITILSLMPPKSGVEIPGNDKVNHFIAYAIFSLNAGLLSSSMKKNFLFLPLLVLYGLFMEYCQGFVPGRQPSWLDALANTTGVAIGFLLTLLTNYLRTKISH